MRATQRLLAAVKPGRFLEPGNPTGLTGLFNHSAPRSTLIYLYGATLKKLESLPEHSVYRQSTEALTKHRMSIIESIKPDGFDAWYTRAKETMEKNPDAFQPVGQGVYEMTPDMRFEQPDVEEEDVEDGLVSSLEGRSEAEKINSLSASNAPNSKKPDMRLEQLGEEVEEYNEEIVASLERARSEEESAKEPEISIEWETEPPLNAEQINDAETQIGAGLIEEVILVAESELKLIDTMLESKVWEELEEKPPQGQWDYFARDQHTPGTQEPPSK